VTLLGLDADVTHARLRAIAALPHAERRLVSFKTNENPTRTAQRAAWVDPNIRRRERRAQKKMAA